MRWLKLDDCSDCEVFPVIVSVLLSLESSNSFTEYFVSKEFRNLEAFAIATQPAPVFCSDSTRSQKVDASHFIRVSVL